jgi:uncharacterized protein YkwD
MKALYLTVFILSLVFIPATGVSADSGNDRDIVSYWQLGAGNPDPSITSEGVVIIAAQGKRPVGDLSGYPQQVLDAVNIERQKTGAPPMKMDPKLLKATSIRAVEITKVFSHDRPDGTSFETVFGEVGFTGERAYGENVAMGYMSPAEAVDGWMTSSGHRKNILNNRYTLTGIGVAANGEGRLFWVQIFVGTK